jgi:hypothetical protein
MGVERLACHPMLGAAVCHNPRLQDTGSDSPFSRLEVLIFN